MTHEESSVTETVTLSASADIVHQDGERRHDPLCPTRHCIDRYCAKCCRCDLIAQVREDEREGWYEAQSETWEQGYAAALRDAAIAVAAVPKEDGGYCHVLHACDVEAAIEALGGTP